MTLPLELQEKIKAKREFWHPNIEIVEFDNAATSFL